MRWSPLPSAGWERHGERVIVDIPESLPEVQTDPALLERAVANLIENALIWSPSTRIGESERRGNRPPHRPPDHRPRARHPSRLTRTAVFQPFQRLGDSPRSEGVGLGLAVSQGLLEAMGNELIIEDTPGGGTTMVIGFKIAGPIDIPGPVTTDAHV